MPTATDASRAMRRSMGLEPSSAPRLLPDTMIAGRYRILDILGEGGMGTVYRAEQPALHRQVALKVVRPELSADASMVARFEREAYASSRISSPHVVVVHDFGRAESGVLFLVMELLEGESLASRLEREGPLPVGESLRICRDVGRALEVAHAAGIVHRDLKPDNVFLTSAGDVKVLDFGIARIVEGPSGPVSGNATMTGMIVGTPVYMSPEAISRAPVGPASDLYSLGVMLFEMLAGEPPFMAGEAVVLMSQHLTAPVPSIEARVPSLAKKPGVAALVTRLLSKDPAARGDTKAASAELTRLAKQFGDTSQHELVRPVIATAPVDVPPPSRGGGAWIALGTATVLVVLGVGIALSLQGGPTASSPSPPTPPATTSTPSASTVEPPVPAGSDLLAGQAPPPLPERVSVTITNLPEGAVVEAIGATIDGNRVEVPRDSGPHAVIVRAEGYELETFEIDSHEDSTRALSLTRSRRRVERRSSSPATGDPPASTEPRGTGTTDDRGGLRREF